jgi:hypothetical protein
MDPKLLAPHVLHVLAVAQRRGQMLSLDAIADRVDARRSDVRTVLSELHREGHLDILHMRLTLSGFALAVSLPRRPLRRPIRARAA